MFNSMGQTNPQDLGNGGTLDGDVTITGDLTVSGGIGLSLSEVIEGTSTIDVTSTEALLVRKNSDGGDVFVVDTTNSRVGIGTSSPTGLFSIYKSGGAPEMIWEVAGNSGARNWGWRASGSAWGDFQLRQGSSLGGALDTHRITVLDGGNVGIGTNSPDSLLHLEDSSGTVTMRIKTGGNSPYKPGIILATSGDVAEFQAYGSTGEVRIGGIGSNYFPTFYSNNSEAMRIDTSGNVGIGTSSPSHALTVAGEVKFTLGGSAIAVFNTVGGDGAMYITDSDGATKVNIDTEGDSYFNGGNVGIGTSSPDQTMHIHKASAGSIASDSNTVLTVENSDHSLISILSPEAKDGAVMFGNPTDGALDGRLVYDNADRALQFWTAGTQRTTIDSSGNVGIGDTTPDNTLSIYGGNKQIRMGATDSNYLLIGRNSSTGHFEMGRTCTGAADEIFFRANEASGGDISFPTGNVGIGTSSPTDYDAGGDNLVVYDSGNSGISIIAGTSGTSAIHFGDGTSAASYRGYINYSHSSDSFTFATSANARFKLDANSRISLSNNDSGTGNTIFGHTAGDAITGGYSTFIGYHAGLVHTSGGYNMAIGYGAMDDTNAGSNSLGSTENIFIGVDSGGGTWVDTSSSYNVALGSYTMDAALDGANYNVAIGYQALSAHTEGDYNTVLGAQAGLDSTTGAVNTLIGFRAGYDIIGGAENTFVGSSAGLLTTAVVGATLIGREAGGGGVITTGANYTTAVGFQALYNLTTGLGNVAIGYQTGFYNSTGANCTYIGHSAGKGASGYNNSNNVGIGASAMLIIRTGDENVAVGTEAMKDAQTASNNVAIGQQALQNMTSGSSNVAIGKVALDGAGVNPSNSTAVGYAAGRYAEGNNNVALGHSALKGVSGFDGINNVAIGYEALDAVTDGEEANIAIGYGSMGAVNESASHHADANIAIGYNALTGGTLTDGNLSHNIAIGYEALDATGANDQLGTIAIGYAALGALTSGAGNTAVGYQAMDELTTGDYNTAVGYQALHQIDNGEGNCTAVGYLAGGNLDGGVNNTFVGDNTTVGTATDDNNTIIGSASTGGGTNSTVIGYNTTGQAANSVTLGNASVTDVFMGQDKGAAVRADNNKVVCQGIEFPDTQSASGDANILDDYEEGTFTPVWVSASGTLGTINYTNQVGKYTKIGNAVTVTISFYNGSFAVGTGSGTLKVTGLPFTAGAKSSLALGDTRLFGGDNPTEAEVDNGAVTVTLYYRDAADGANTALQTADAATGTGAFNLITLSGTYFV
jgi:hypothetical protein